MTSCSGVVADGLEAEEEVEVVEEGKGGATKMVEGTPNSRENISVLMMVKVDLIKHRGQSR